jgi:signal transduction histidine kinase
MPDPPIDPRWPKILSLSVHEFRTPLTVVAGYIRMLLKDRAGPLNDQQRRLLEEAEKSCARLSALVAEVSELSALAAGTATFNRQRADLHAILAAAVDQLPPLVDREVAVDVRTDGAPAPIDADPIKLGQALASVIAASRRELVETDRLVVRVARTQREGADVYDVQIGDEQTVAAVQAQAETEGGVFDEWRGGVGLSLANARRILNAHGSGIWPPPDGRKTGARIILPAAAPK